jgi:hypothetical protein
MIWIRILMQVSSVNATSYESRLRIIGSLTVIADAPHLDNLGYPERATIP